MTLIDDARTSLANDRTGVTCSPLPYLRAALEALDAVLAIHAPGTVYALADECGHTEDSDEHGVAVTTGDAICLASPTGETFCAGCRPDDFGEPMPWPCPTALAAGAKAPEEASS